MEERRLRLEQERQAAVLSIETISHVMDLFPSDLVFGVLENVVPRPVVTKTHPRLRVPMTEVIYPLTSEIGICRQQWEDLDEEKGRDKFIGRICSADGFQTWSWAKGTGNVPPYCLEEAINAALMSDANVVFGFEGAHKAEKARVHLGYPSVGFEVKTVEGIRPTAQYFREAGLILVYFRDWDGAGKQYAEKVQQAFNQEGAVCIVVDDNQLEGIYPNPDIHKGQDVVDSIDKVIDFQSWSSERQAKVNDTRPKSFAELKARMESAARESMPNSYGNLQKEVARLEKVIASTPGEKSRNSHPEVKIRPADVANRVIDQYGTTLLWESSTGGQQRNRWLAYSIHFDGVWHPITSETLAREYLAPAMRELGVTATPTFYENAEKLLRVELEKGRWRDSNDLIPFRNGVLNKKSGEFLPHDPKYHLQWQLPYDYLPPSPLVSREGLIGQCRPIWDWLVEAVGGEVEDEQIAHLLCAYLAAVIKGRVDLQRFLACIGSAGSGKGTFVRLATALIGIENTGSTSLSELEKNRFALVKVANSRLVAISEAEKWGGECTQLKSLTGQDLLSQEQKGIQEEVGQGSYAKGLVILAGERMPGGSDTGGLARRRIVVEFKNPVAAHQRRNLIEVTTTEVRGEFAPYLGAFFNLLLSYSDQEIRQYVLETDTYVPRLSYQRADSLLQGNTLLQWVDQNLYYDSTADPSTGLPGLATQVGRKVDERGEDGVVTCRNADKWLFANYIQWCREQNISGREILACSKFTSELVSVVSTQLGLTGIFSKKLSHAQHVFSLGIRDESHESYPAIVTELYPELLSRQAAALRQQSEPSHIFSSKEESGVEGSFPQVSKSFPQGGVDLSQKVASECKYMRTPLVAQSTDIGSLGGSGGSFEENSRERDISSKDLLIGGDAKKSPLRNRKTTSDTSRTSFHGGSSNLPTSQDPPATSQDDQFPEVDMHTLTPIPESVISFASSYQPLTDEQIQYSHQDARAAVETVLYQPEASNDEHPPSKTEEVVLPTSVIGWSDGFVAKQKEEYATRKETHTHFFEDRHFVQVYRGINEDGDQEWLAPYRVTGYEITELGFIHYFLLPCTKALAEIDRDPRTNKLPLYRTTFDCFIAGSIRPANIRFEDPAK